MFPPWLFYGGCGVRVSTFLPLRPGVPYTLPHYPLAQLPSHLAPPLYWDKFSYRSPPTPTSSNHISCFEWCQGPTYPTLFTTRMRTGGDESLLSIRVA